MELLHARAEGQLGNLGAFVEHSDGDGDEFESDSKSVASGGRSETEIEANDCMLCAGDVLRVHVCVCCVLCAGYGLCLV